MKPSRKGKKNKNECKKKHKIRTKKIRRKERWLSKNKHLEKYSLLEFNVLEKNIHNALKSDNKYYTLVVVLIITNFQKYEKNQTKMDF